MKINQNTGKSINLPISIPFPGTRWFRPPRTRGTSAAAWAATQPGPRRGTTGSRWAMRRRRRPGTAQKMSLWKRNWVKNGENVTGFHHFPIIFSKVKAMVKATPVGKTMMNHPWLGMVYTSWWWFGGWFIIVLPTLLNFQFGIMVVFTSQWW